MDWIVGDGRALTAALNSAHSGDTILLSGGHYDPVTISGIHFADDVTIRSANAASQAVLSGLLVRNSSGLTFEDLEFYVSPQGGQNQFRVLDSSDIHFDGLDVHGSMNDDPTDDVTGIQIKTSDHVSVTNSEFQQLAFALGHRDDSSLVVQGNTFHDIRIDGVRGSGSSNVLIAENYFWDFKHRPGDHSDAIQFWSSDTEPHAYNLTIRDNVIFRGDGEVMQGIFIVDSDAKTFHSVKITGNLVVGGNFNGIMVEGADGVTITKNTVLGATSHTSWIRLLDTDNVVVRGNSANKLLFNDSVKHMNNANNILSTVSAAAANEVLADWMRTHRVINLALDDGAALNADWLPMLDTFQLIAGGFLTPDVDDSFDLAGDSLVGL